MNYLTSGRAPKRAGNAHPNIVPYQVFAAADGHVIVAVGNDAQYAKFCEVAGRGDLATDPRFVRNADRVRHRAMLVPMLEELVRQRSVAWWLESLDAAKVPCGPINDIAQALADPQVAARGMLLSRGDATVFFTRPLSLTLLVMAGALIAIVALPQISAKREEAFQEVD